MHVHMARALVQQRQQEVARMARRKRRKARMFMNEPEGAGTRVYLTDSQTRQLFAEWERLLARFAERGTAQAAPYELVMLGRRVDA